MPSGTTLDHRRRCTWPDTGNLVNLYLIDPSGDLRDAKGGDLVWYPDYSSFLVPAVGLPATPRSR